MAMATLPHAIQSFRYVLPPSRLGKEHATLEAFQKAANNVTAITQRHQKAYSLVLVIDPSTQSILLGEKHRGFGKGMINSFGGKVEKGESDAESARRELEEETGISVPQEIMSRSKLGVLRFTFEDNRTEMVVHLYRINVCCCEGGDYDNGSDDPSPKENKDSSSSSSYRFPIDPKTIRGCEEITPFWVENWYDIAFDKMFADDSVWLTRILRLSSTVSPPSSQPIPQEDVLVDGWFHFKAGAEKTNTLLHYYFNLRPRVAVNATTDSTQKVRISNGHGQAEPSFTLEKQLFHALHDSKIRSPCHKEFNESFAFVNAVRSFFGKKSFDLVIDVAGGHGALAALFLIMTSAKSAVVIDPAQVGGGGVEKAWGHRYRSDNSNIKSNKDLRYRHECLRTGLPSELSHALGRVDANRVLVVACHACQHLSDETLQIACQYGVHAAVMPCCQKDTSPGSSWKATSKRLGVPIGKIMDILLAGKAMSWTTGVAASTSVTYDVRMKVIDEKITPQNRLILCRAQPLAIDQRQSGETSREKAIAKAHRKLELAYKRAHPNSIGTKNGPTAHLLWFLPSPSLENGLYLVTGFALGLLSAFAALKRNDQQR